MLNWRVSISFVVVNTDREMFLVTIPMSLCNFPFRNWKLKIYCFRVWFDEAIRARQKYLGAIEMEFR